MIQNTDIKVRATLTDGTNPYTISALNDYEIYLYYVNVNTKQKLATYKKANTGAYAISVYDDLTGKVDFVVNRELTRGLSDGKLYAEFMVQLSVGSEFISSKQNVGANGVYLFDVVSSASPNSLI